MGTRIAILQLNSNPREILFERIFTEDPPFGGLWCDQPALFLPGIHTAELFPAGFVSGREARESGGPCG